MLSCLVLFAPSWEQRHGSYNHTTVTLNKGESLNVRQLNGHTSHVQPNTATLGSHGGNGGVRGA